MTALKEKFQKALDADLNTSLAITTLYDVLKADMHDVAKLALLDSFDQVLGLSLLAHADAKRKEAAKTTSASTASGYQITGEGDPEIDALVLKRYEAKKAKNFAEADKIRDDLKAQGIEVADVRGGASGNGSDLHERGTLIFFFISYEGNREFHVLKATTDQYITCENAAALSIKLLPKRTALMRQFSFYAFSPAACGFLRMHGIEKKTASIFRIPPFLFLSDGCFFI